MVLTVYLADKATSQLLLETDWESILQICDLIRQGDAQWALFFFFNTFLNVVKYHVIII